MPDPLNPLATLVALVHVRVTPHGMPKPLEERSTLARFTTPSAKRTPSGENKLGILLSAPLATRSMSSSGDVMYSGTMPPDGVPVLIRGPSKPPVGGLKLPLPMLGDAETCGPAGGGVGDPRPALLL